MTDLIEEYELKLKSLHDLHALLKIDGSRECSIKCHTFAAKSECYIEFIKKLRALES